MHIELEEAEVIHDETTTKAIPQTKRPAREGTDDDCRQSLQPLQLPPPKPKFSLRLLRRTGRHISAVPLLRGARPSKYAPRGRDLKAAKPASKGAGNAGPPVNPLSQGTRPSKYASSGRDLKDAKPEYKENLTSFRRVPLCRCLASPVCVGGRSVKRPISGGCLNLGDVRQGGREGVWVRGPHP